MDTPRDTTVGTGDNHARNRPASLLLLMLAIVVVLTAWSEITVYRTVVANQRQLARQSVEVVAAEISHYIANLRHSTRLLLQDRGGLVEALLADPEDSTRYRALAARLAAYHPEFFAFTLADSNGNVIYDDFGERIGALCRQDIQAFTHGGNSDNLHLHPGPGVYHFDVMQPWPVDDGSRRVFFASYRPNVVARLLQQGQVVGHRLILVRRDRPRLIEVTASGARDTLQRPIRLDDGEWRQQEKLGASLAVAQTNWQLLDLPDPTLFAQARRTGWLRGLGIIAAACLFALFNLRRIHQEAARREQAEQALRLAHTQLERKVEERTRELSQANAELAAQVSRRQRAEESMTMLSRAVQYTGDTILISDREGCIEYVNPAFERLTGQPADQLVGSQLAELQGKLGAVEFMDQLRQQLAQDSVYRDTFEIDDARGVHRFTEQTITALRDDSGEVTHLVATGRDITERVDSERRLAHLAHHDTLTDLPNRALMLDRLGHALARADRKGTRVALLFMDIDRFKTVNDSLGHQAGDKLLKAVAERLAGGIRRSDSIARLGGDEFVAILEDIGSPDEPAHVASTVLAAINQPLLLAGHELSVSSSMGITLYPDDADDANGLLQCADAAMYRAKAAGGNTFNFYTADMTAEAQRRLQLESRLRNALVKGEFHLCYQPRCENAEGRITAVEALLRWQPPGEEVHLPVEFVPVLEETGLIREVGAWVMQQTCEDYTRIRSAGHDLRIACNLSAKQFHDAQLVAIIDQAVTSQDMRHDDLELEITERLLVDDIPHATMVLEQLHDRGVHISVDDFGTGYSSLNYLKRFPIDYLKVDQSFVHELNHDRDDAAIVTAIIGLAHSLGMAAVAEGVETRAQLQTLSLLDCDEMQGMLISAPLPIEELLDWLATHAAG